MMDDTRNPIQTPLRADSRAGVAKRAVARGGAAIGLAFVAAAALLPTGASLPAPFAAGLFPGEITAQTQVCIQCYRDQAPVINERRSCSKHYRADVVCWECHAAMPSYVDAVGHYGEVISISVSPKGWGRCQSKEVSEFNEARHSKGARILVLLDNTLAEG